MTDFEFDKWVTDFSVAHEAEQLIRVVRESEPFRRVQGGRGNVVGRYPSKKMGCTIQFDSHTVEFPYAMEFENDHGVLEFYDQPLPLKLTYKNVNGLSLGIVVTTDYFTICSDGTAGWEECKEETELVELSEKHPARYLKDKNGNWRSKAG